MKTKFWSKWDTVMEISMTTLRSKGNKNQVKKSSKILIKLDLKMYLNNSRTMWF